MQKISTNAYFEDIGLHIEQELMKAKESVKICVAWISWQKYAPIFDQLTRKGVYVEVMYNDDFLNKKNFQAPSHSTILYPVKNRFGALMHNKFCIIDNTIVLTGSFNWSKNARRHFENLVVIKNDFDLVKKYLTEFMDLKNYFSDFALKTRIQCQYRENYLQCGGASYNLGILGNESGIYDDSLIEIWNVCLRHEHAKFLGEDYENHLHSYLGLKDGPDYEHDFIHDKDSILNEMRKDFKQIEDIRKHFIFRRKQPIHAIGVVSILNENEHLEWGEEQEFGINILWRDMYFRKVIPEIIYDDGYGFVASIINKHR